MIITTHYIEETISSDLIGYIRNGHLICEQSPRKLMQMYNCNNLENILFRLCRKQSIDVRAALRKERESGKKIDLTAVQVEDQELPTRPPVANDDFDFSIPTLVNQLTRNIRNFFIVTKRSWKLVMSRTLNVGLILFYSSLMMVMFYGMFYKLPDRIPIGIINPDQSENISLSSSIIEPLVNRTHMVC